MFLMTMIKRIRSYHKGNTNHEVFKTEVLDNVDPE